MVWLGFVAAMFILRADFRRRRLAADPQTVILWLALAGMAGSKLYHVLQTPDVFFSRPFHTFFSPTGFAWFGGFLAGILALLLLAAHYRIPMLTMLDAGSPAAAFGYAIGRLGCLLSGDGDYGIPTNLPWGMTFLKGLVPSNEVCLAYGRAPDCTVHPTPIYEFLAFAAIGYFIWRRGQRGLQEDWPSGVLVGQYLVLSGMARFLVEFIRLNPPVFVGLTDAQVVSLLSIAAGSALIFRRRSSLSSAP